MLVLDVDGVLTDGRIIYDDRGVEIKVFHVRDGSGLKIWQAAGKQVALISGRSSRTVDVRSRELGIAMVFQGVANKMAVYRHLLAGADLKPEQVCALGDDLPDLPVLLNAGLAVAVADACSEVRTAAHYVTHAGGGCGAVRETIEWVLRGQGRWQPLVDRYRGQDLTSSDDQAGQYPGGTP
jgi:YrbI family 3-deoxy-D-manno-octulosonate 8-phosphate phosphatase